MNTCFIDPRYGTRQIVEIRFGKYPNQRIGVRLWADGEPWCTASINLPDVEIPDDAIAIMDFAHNTGVLKLLSMNNVIEPIPLLITGNGSHLIPVHRLTTAALKAVSEQGDLPVLLDAAEKASVDPTELRFEFNDRRRGIFADGYTDRDGLPVGDTFAYRFKAMLYGRDARDWSKEQLSKLVSGYSSSEMDAIMNAMCELTVDELLIVVYRDHGVYGTKELRNRIPTLIACKLGITINDATELVKAHFESGLIVSNNFTEVNKCV